MAIHEHYFEVLDVIEKLFGAIFNGLATKYGEARSPANATLRHALRPVTYASAAAALQRMRCPLESLGCLTLPAACVACMRRNACPPAVWRTRRRCCAALCFVAAELAVISKQYPFDIPTFKPLRLTFPEGIKLLQARQRQRCRYMRSTARMQQSVASCWASLP